MDQYFEMLDEYAKEKLSVLMIFPDVLWMEIFERMEPVSLFRMSHICRKFRRMASGSWSYLLIWKDNGLWKKVIKARKPFALVLNEKIFGKAFFFSARASLPSPSGKLLHKDQLQFPLNLRSSKKESFCIRNRGWFLKSKGYSTEIYPHPLGIV